MTALMESPAREFLERLGGLIERPKAILVASAHWETEVPTLSAPALAAQAADLLAKAGFACKIDQRRGLDHGAWVPLLLAYPEANIPVLQLSLQTEAGPRHHLALGAALAPLREQGVMVIGSGSFTHDLRRFRGGRATLDAPETPDVTEFSEWMDAHIRAGDVRALVDYRRFAPHAVEEHPSEEHLLPLFVALGAAGAHPKAERLHSSVEFGFLRMDTYKFA